MENENKTTGKNWTLKKNLKYFLLLILVIISIVTIYTYNNFNKILTGAIHNAFNSNVISNVYELKFKKLRFNPIKGNISVIEVVFQPREKPLKVYPYINSSFILKTGKILLKNIDLLKLIKDKELDLKRIELIEPEIDLKMSGEKIEFFPYKDTLIVKNKDDKKKLGSYFLSDFEMINARVYSENTNKEREFKLNGCYISANDFTINQDSTGASLFCKKAKLRIDKFSSNLKKDKIRNLNFSDFYLKIDSINLLKSPDTIVYHFKDYSVNVKDFDIQTSDSVFALVLQTFHLSFADKTMQINGFSLTPDIKKASKLEKYKYQIPPVVTVTASSIVFKGLNFDTLVYRKKLFVDELIVDSLTASIFKDKNKPINLKRFAEYPGQKIKKLKLPVNIKNVKASNVIVNNDELKPDGTHAKVKVSSINAEISNYTNIDSIDPMILKGSGSIENKAFFNINLAFSYQLPQFNFQGNIEKFDLTDLNHLLKSYAPVNIKSGIADQITFSGTAYKTSSTGTLTFLYHDLDIDLQLKERAQWQSDIVSFAANSYMNNANPVKSDQPPRVVKFDAIRDMNKGFLNIVIKSFLDGLKETIIMSKENRESHREEKNKSSK